MCCEILANSAETEGVMTPAADFFLIAGNTFDDAQDEENWETREQ
jgi:hypothetical protein